MNFIISTMGTAGDRADTIWYRQEFSELLVVEFFFQTKTRAKLHGRAGEHSSPETRRSLPLPPHPHKLHFQPLKQPGEIWKPLVSEKTSLISAPK